MIRFAVGAGEFGVRDLAEWAELYHKRNCMTLEEIDNQLVNGFHDAIIIESRHSYEDATMHFVVDILIELPETAPKSASRYRRAELLFTGVELCTIDTPDPASAFPNPGGIWFKFERLDESVWPSAVIDRLGPNMLMYSLFILDWHSSIHIAAKNVQFQWAKTPHEQTSALPNC